MFTGQSLHLYTLHRRVFKLMEISGQPGIVKIGPGAATQLLVARGAPMVILTHLRQKCRSEPTRRERLCASPRANLNDPGLSGYLHELGSEPAERMQV